MSSDAVQTPQPQTILRGHKAQVHAASFIRGNDRLATGDADGFVVLWDLTIMRPRAVWQAHTNAILGIAGWGSERLITHGRDNRLVVWKVGPEDEGSLSTSLPLDVTSDVRPQPGMVHMLEVNTMNFCSFASCAPLGVEQSPDELLVAVPNTLASEAIDIFHLPSQLRRHTVKLGDKNGMVMALAIFYLGSILTIAAGYENGLATVAQLDDKGTWVVKYRAQCHSQPILSLDIAPDLDYFVTASADAIVAKHPLPPRNIEAKLDAAPDSQPNANEQESGPAELSVEGKHKSLLSAALAAQSSQPQPTIKEPDDTQIQTQPLRVVNTKHAGQQGIRIRSDGKIFATAGWDAKVRVYSTKTLREVAVLKWHQVGCYAIAFSNLQATSGSEAAATSSRERTEKASTVVPRLLDMTVKERRIQQAATAHWLAAGSKDGKVSLWDVF